ncbi:MAG: NUDIX hydrolase [Bacilli bacterium]|nr:NUDIX hydrolase [Bacilli bacterium]
MRKEVEKRIDEIIEKYKTVELELIDNGDSFIDVNSYRVKLNNGIEFYRSKIIKNKGRGSSSSILPILSNGNVLLVVEPRVFTEKTVEISIPGGYIDEGETPIQAAKRELEEETGLVPKELIQIADYYPDMGNCDHINYLYIALNCEKNKNTKFDSDEFVEYIEVTMDEFFELVDKGMINNAATIIGALKLKVLQNKEG